MTFTYAATVAWDPIGKQAVKNASFQVFATTDTSFTNPLPITDPFGATLPGNILNSGTQGVFPQFKQANNSTVVITDPSHTYAWTVNAVMEDAAIANFIQNSASATAAALATTYATTAALAGKRDVLPAAARLFGSLAARNVTPCRLAFAGSSTTQGVGASTEANRWVNQFVSAVQAAYPSSAGTEAATVASTSATWGTVSTAPGVQGYNAGEGGTASDNYLVTSELAAINSLNPAAVFHMVGSNDFYLGYTPAFVKSNVQSKIATLKGYGNSTPCVHVLIQSYERFDQTTHAYPWADYAAVLKQIADEDPANVVFIDLSGVFTALGIPAADPLDLINPDNIHPQDSGHSLLADSVRRALGIGLKTAPAAAVSSPAQLVSTRLTSDNASGPNVTDVIGPTTDAVIGGAGKVWTGDPASSVAITSNAFVRGATVNNFTAVLAEPVADIELSAVINALPVGDSLIMDLHRQLSTVAGSPNAYRLYIATTGALTLAKRISGSQINLATGYTCSVGDRLAIRYYKGTLEVRVNGVVRLTAADTSVASPGFAGLSGTAALTSFSMKSLALDAIT